jgi:hypothetical protein
MAKDSGMTAQSHARVGGSGFTWFNFNNVVFIFAQAIGLTSPAPVADAVPVQPLNYRRPVEIVTPRAIGAGTITVTGIELWNQPVWQRLPGMANAVDLADVFQIMYNQGTDDIQAHIVVDPPVGRGTAGQKYYRHFHGVKLTNIDDGEQVDITTMTLNKPVTFMYAWEARSGTKPAFQSKISTDNQ